MPLCVLLWILVLIPAAMLAWFLFAMMTDMDSDPAVQGLVILSLLLTFTAPNLLWYKAVRDVMLPEAAPVSLTVEKSPGSTKNEPVEAIGVYTMTLPAAVTPLMAQ